VPVDDKWHTNPYEPVIVNDCIIGRGVEDNKGAAIGSLYIMKAIKELGIELKHNITLYMGTNEENGMLDMDYYMKNEYPLPKFSLVPDAGWPGMRGQFGRIEFDLITNEKISDDIVEFEVGQATNIIPNEASITLKKSCGFDVSKVPADGYEITETDDTVTIKAIGTGGHAAWPQGKLNALLLLTKVVADNGCLCEYDQKIFDFITAINEDMLGAPLGIDGEDEYGETVCSATMATVRDGKLYIRNDCRFMVSGVFEELTASIIRKAAEAGMSAQVLSHMNGSARPLDSPVVQIVLEEYEKAKGIKKDIPVMRGGTYAGKLPRALATGMCSIDRSLFPDYIVDGYGGGHQPDEALPIKDFFEGMKLFTSILLRIDEEI
ncbi:MAG: M20 family metallopeptidase, partial [Clostridiales bacterium]|nr:M20 family metallopeptidase [Clostridiales bacterium]